MEVEMEKHVCNDLCGYFDCSDVERDPEGCIAALVGAEDGFWATDDALADNHEHNGLCGYMDTWKKAQQVVHRLENWQGGLKSLAALAYARKVMGKPNATREECIAHFKYYLGGIL